MFESAELGRKMSKKEYEARVPQLRMDLLDAQTKLKAAKFPVLIIIGGVDGAGKGETVNLLSEWLDPRFLEVSAFDRPSDEERERPDYWRFWRVMPPKGKIGVFFGSWYTDPIVKRTCGNIGDPELNSLVDQIRKHENLWVDDGMLLIKFWFHLSKEAQRKRLKSLEKDDKTAWRVTPTDWKHFEMYDSFRDVSGRVISATSTPDAPWTIVEGEDPQYRSVLVGETLLELLKRRLEAPKPPRLEEKHSSIIKREEQGILEKLDVSKSIEAKDYKKQIELAQGKLNKAYRKAKAKGVPLVLLFEGWDAAGKGGLIRRITPAMDARDYRIVPIAAPTDEEKARHYLWRFWRNLPREGKVTIFDRSWYGRVLVERIEGFARKEEWSRAYSEINDFEQQLADNGIVLIKFWLHIDKDEQLRRFKDRAATPFKNFKITDEDWRNREKWDDYEIAVNKMVARTSTTWAPWYLLEGNDKKYARVKAVNTVVDALKKRLKED
jgi:polyphosphate:AMP phosphotransferase